MVVPLPLLVCLSYCKDSVNHQILLKKLNHYGFCGKVFNFLKSYLADQKICTKLDGKVSSTRSVQYGVPQRSILGPLLFLLYVNDLPFASNFETTLFADDTNLHISHHNIHVLQSQIKQEVNKISNWMLYNKFSINYKKAVLSLLLKSQ